jgi:hypothetical protein
VLAFQEATTAGVARGCNEAVAAGGNTFRREIANSGRLITDHGPMSEIARRSMPEVEEWRRAVLPIWAAAGLSMTEFAADAPIDKGSISRYLSGKRVPRDRWFLDRLLEIVARNGSPVTPEVRENLTRLQLRALEAAHPHAYQIRRLRDELAIAVTGRREAGRYAHGLEEELAEREREIQGLTEDKNRLRATLDFEYERLNGEIEQLTREVDFARRRAAEAEGRCMVLGSMLDLVDQTHPDQLQEGDHSYSVDWGSIVLYLPLDNLNAVALFLSVLLQLDLRDQAAVLADRVVAHISGRHYTPDDTAKHDGHRRLLATMNAHGLYDQADKLSSWMGYPNSRRRLPRHPMVRASAKSFASNS